MATRYETAQANWRVSLEALLELAKATEVETLEDALDDYIALDADDTDLIDRMLEAMANVTVMTGEADADDIVSVAMELAARDNRPECVPLLVALHMLDRHNARSNEGDV